MSIYATLWSIQIQDPAALFSEPRWVEVTAQAVPPHIGSPTPGCGYEDGDPYAGFLPPPVEVDRDGNAPFNRGRFHHKRDAKGHGSTSQEYVEPLFILSENMRTSRLMTFLAIAGGRPLRTAGGR